jgi:NADPH:quinone reductase-like Zn-dependent oxidoreductase
VAFAGINFADVHARVGLYPAAPKPPCVLGYEVSGEIDAVGEGVTDYRPGDRVFGLSRFGGQAELCCVPTRQIAPLPSGKSLEEAAALPVNYLTAYYMLHHAASIQAGQKLLIHQAAGGVGTAVIELGRICGAEMFGTASAPKHERLRAMGLLHPIDYRHADFAEVIKRIAGPRPLALALDPVGSDSWRKSYELLAPGGTLLIFGFSAMVSGPRRNPWRMLRQVMRMPRYSPLKLMGDNRNVGGVDMAAPDVWKSEHLTGTMMGALIELWSRGQIAPIVDRVFEAKDAAEAHRYLQQAKNFGKVLLRF